MRVRETQGLIGLLTRVRGGAQPIVPALAVGVLLFAFFAFPLAAAGRRIDTRRAAELGIDGRGDEGLRVNSRRDATLHRVRLMSWTGATLSIAGGVVAASALWITIAEHPLVLALGVLPWIGWGGWLSLAGALVAWGGAVDYVRRRRRTLNRIGTEVGLAATALASAVFLVFLSSSGAAPV